MALGTQRPPRATADTTATAGSGKAAGGRERRRAGKKAGRGAGCHLADPAAPRPGAHPHDRARHRPAARLQLPAAARQRRRVPGLQPVRLHQRRHGDPALADGGPRTVPEDGRRLRLLERAPEHPHPLRHPAAAVLPGADRARAAHQQRDQAAGAGPVAGDPLPAALLLVGARRHRLPADVRRRGTDRAAAPGPRRRRLRPDDGRRDLQVPAHRADGLEGQPAGASSSSSRRSPPSARSCTRRRRWTARTGGAACGTSHRPRCGR